MRQQTPLRLGIVLATLLAFTVTACVSSTVIQTNVPGARVYLNDMYVGNTPYVMSDTKIVGSATRVRIEADGYEPFVTNIYRNEVLDVGACIGGVFLLVPFLWIMGYQPDRFYELRPHGPQYPPQPYPEQPAGSPAPYEQPADSPAEPYEQPQAGKKPAQGNTRVANHR